MTNEQLDEIERYAQPDNNELALVKALREALAIIDHYERKDSPMFQAHLGEAKVLMERDEARAEVARLRGIVEVNDRRLAAVWDEARAEVKQLREVLETAGDRLRAYAYELTEHAYQEMASVIFDLPASATIEQLRAEFPEVMP